MIRRALLSEVHEISRTASAIAEGDLTRRVHFAALDQPELFAAELRAAFKSLR